MERLRASFLYTLFRCLWLNKSYRYAGKQRLAILPRQLFREDIANDLQVLIRLSLARPLNGPRAVFLKFFV